MDHETNAILESIVEDNVRQVQKQETERDMPESRAQLYDDDINFIPN